MSFMNRFSGETHALMRIMFGLNFLLHGSQKLIGLPQAAPDAPAFVLYVAGSIELIGGALIAVGFLTRPVAFLSAGLMAAAYWMAHGLNHMIPMINKGELAVLYCFVFLFLAANGAGKWSVDGAGGEAAS